jgi:hypothetical protein
MKKILYDFMKNKLAKLFDQEMIIFEVDGLVHYSRRRKKNTEFFNN